MPRLLRSLFALAWLACAVGLWQGRDRLPWQARGDGIAPDWAARYAVLLPELTGETQVMLLHGCGPDRCRHRAYRAQFVLAPTVVQERSTVEVVKMHHLRQRPLILDFQNRGAMQRALRSLRQEARARDLELEVRAFPRHVALVRAHRMPR